MGLPSNRYGKVEEGKHAGTLATCKQVCDDRRCYGGIACLTHTDQAPQHQKHRKMLCEIHHNVHPQQSNTVNKL